MKTARLAFFVMLLGAGSAHAQNAAPPPATPAPTILPPQAVAAPAAAQPSTGTVAAPPPTGDPATSALSPSDPAPADLAPALEPVPEAAAGGALDIGAVEGGLSEAELAELGFSTTAPAVDTNLKVSGFMDFGVGIGVDKEAREVRRPSFSIGSLNVYLSKNLTESLRTMAEIRFTYLPNGARMSAADAERISTFATDYADFERPLRWGGIEIERAYLDWSAHRFLTIRLGSFLTPYGIWNVDHGSPTIISTARPFVIGQNFFPERQTGAELFGRWEASAYNTVGYHLTLSNGTGPVSEYLDLDKNKAVGGRVFWEYRKLGELRIGGSAYYGRETTSTPRPRPQVGETIVAQYDALALAADMVWRYQGVHVQAEWITRQARYTDEGRTAVFNTAVFRPTYPSDAISRGGYGLLGYRFDWMGVMPYLILQRLSGVDVVAQSSPKPFSVIGGLNIRPVDMLAFKIDYAHVKFMGDKPIYAPGGKLKIVTLQVAWAF